MHHKYTRPLLALAILALTQLMCRFNTWTRNPFAGGNGRNLCSSYQIQLEDGSPVSGVCVGDSCSWITDENGFHQNDKINCVENPTQAQCNQLNAVYSEGAPAGYTLVSESATPFDCSDNPTSMDQFRVVTLIVAPLDQPEPPTEEPTAPPTEPPTDPAPLNPYLAGTFTTCDNAARYVNFTIAENAPAYDPATFKLLFNGEQANCAPAPNNPKILTCNYPPVSYNPPAGIQVFIGEELVNEFDFNGGPICDPIPVPQNNGSDNQPAPTEPPATEPPAPTDVPDGGSD